MSIEKDIRQIRKFRNEHHKVVVNLIFTGNRITEQVRDIVRDFDVTTQQFNVLRILRGSSTPLTTLQIRERMLDKMSDTSRIVERLVAKKLVSKKINRTDKRLVDVVITAKGLRLLQQLDPLDARIEAIADRLSEKEARELNRLLDKMRSSMNE
ncbi:MAG TPA: MarR family transcriptional regulator [Lacibacter sp.]|nr:MarR family transcriptional regulator [Lacibacter sp.]HMO88237.1 MarR family transcriptional regulator [Lacibacter sp.]HMP86160.1 MarR family transcriptional regulator [Lacibacter sp.]